MRIRKTIALAVQFSRRSSERPTCNDSGHQAILPGCGALRIWSLSETLPANVGATTTGRYWKTDDEATRNLRDRCGCCQGA